MCEGEGSSTRFILTHTLKFQRHTTSAKNRRVDQWVGLRENDKPKSACQRAHGEKRGGIDQLGDAPSVFSPVPSNDSDTRRLFTSSSDSP